MTHISSVNLYGAQIGKTETTENASVSILKRSNSANSATTFNNLSQDSKIFSMTESSKMVLERTFSGVISQKTKIDGPKVLMLDHLTNGIEKLGKNN